MAFGCFLSIGKDYHMQAESKPEMLEWISAIQKASVSLDFSREMLPARRL